MVVTIERAMTVEQTRELVRKAQQVSWEKSQKKKLEALKEIKKLSKSLSRLKKTPLEIQEEMRDGWLK